MAGTPELIYDPFNGRHIKPDELIPTADGLLETKHRRKAERALWYYDKAAELYPDDFRITSGRCTALANLERYDEAHDIIDGAMAKNPDDPATAAAMVKLLSAEERHKDALTLAESFAKKRPGGAGSGADLPALRRKVALEERRLRMVDKSLRKDPDELVKAVKKSMKKLQQQMPIALWPGGDVALARDYADMYLKKCRILNNLSRHEEALEAAERSLRHARDTVSWTTGVMHDMISAALGSPTEDGPTRDESVRFVENARSILAVDAKLETLFRLGRYEDALACCRDAQAEFGPAACFERALDKLQKLGHG